MVPLQGAGQTNAQGKFAADPTTTDIDDIRPENYKINMPYPNPFNPSTIITVPVETQGTYELILVNPLGKQIAKYDGELKRGMHTFKIIEPGAAGVYIYGFKGEKGIVSSGKIVYLGGGKTASEIITHTGEKNLPQLNKITDNFTFTLDSILVRGDAIKKTTFPLNIGTYGILDVGNLIVDSAFVNINGKIYTLFDWQQQNNGLEGATIKIGNRQTITNNYGTYNIQAPTGFQQMTITHPNIWTRKTKIVAYSDATIEDLNVIDKTRMPENYLAFYDTLSGRKDPNKPLEQQILTRWIKEMQIYINADTNITRGKQLRDSITYVINTEWKQATVSPMYPEGALNNIIIETGLNPPNEYTPKTYISKFEEDLGGPFALTYPLYNYDSLNPTYLFGEVESAVTKYWKNMPGGFWDNYLVPGIMHEFGFIGGIQNRSNTYPSIWNTGIIIRNFTDYDKRWILYTFSRFPGNRTPDTDYYIYNADTGKWMNPLNGRTIEK